MNDKELQEIMLGMVRAIETSRSRVERAQIVIDDPEERFARREEIRRRRQPGDAPDP